MEKLINEDKIEDIDKKDTVIISNDGLNKENLEQLSKDQLIDFVLAYKHTIIQNKYMRIPFID